MSGSPQDVVNHYAACYPGEAAARSWFKTGKRSMSSASVSVTGQPYAATTAASSFRCVSTSQLELGWHPGARVRLDMAAGCRTARTMSGMTRHPWQGCR